MSEWLLGPDVLARARFAVSHLAVAMVALRRLAVRGRAPGDGRFDPTLAEARTLVARPDLLTPEIRLDGVFAVTPDNLPLVGRFTDRIAVAAAVWVTHSAGAAMALDRVLDDRATDSDRRLDPLRFATGDPQLLHRQALAHYNDIYTRG